MLTWKHTGYLDMTSMLPSIIQQIQDYVSYTNPYQRRYGRSSDLELIRHCLPRN